MESNGFVVVQGGSETAGSVVYWRLRGQTDLGKLRAAWVAAGFDPKLLPHALPAQRALKWAMGDFKAKRVLVRPLSGEKGYTLVSETAKNDDLDYSLALRAYVEQTRGQPTTLRFSPPDHPLAASVQARFDEMTGSITVAEVSAWLSAFIRQHCDAVGMRDRGGIYFVPRHALAKWQKVVNVLREATEHVVFGMPAMPADETVFAIIDSVTAEATEAADEIDAVVNQALVGGKGAPGKRALETKRGEVTRCEEKVARYERIVGQRLEGLRERLERVRAGIVSAMMVASTEDKAA